MTSYPRVLTIAGSDSGGGAGVQADLKTFTAFGTYGMSVVTAVTAQNTRVVQAVYPLPPVQVDEQLQAVLSDIGVDAVKTGALVHADIIEVVAARLRQYAADANSPPSRSVNLVVDPVMIAKSGDPLLEDDAVSALRRNLLPLAAVVTPNIPEAEVLTGIPVRSHDDMVEAARRLLEFGVRAALVTGGHLEGDQADDVLVTADGVRWFPGPKIDTRHTHGTGCTLSAAVAAGLGHGLDLAEAVARAKEYVTAAIANAPRIGGGHGPTNHLVRLEQPGGTKRPAPRKRRLEEQLALYLIVDAKTPLHLVEKLLDTGVGTIQLREKTLSPGRQVPVARQRSASVDWTRRRHRRDRAHPRRRPSCGR